MFLSPQNGGTERFQVFKNLIILDLILIEASDVEYENIEDRDIEFDVR